MISSIKKSGLHCIIIVIVLQFLTAPVSYAGGIKSTRDVIGGENNTSASDNGSNTATTLLVVGGLLFGAVLLYKFVLSKNEKEEDSKKEGKEEKINELASVNERNISNYKSELPFEIKLSFQKMFANFQDRSIVMEVSLPF